MSIIGARIMLDLPEKLKNRLEAAAKEKMVSRAGLIRMIFSDWLEGPRGTEAKSEGQFLEKELREKGEKKRRS